MLAFAIRQKSIEFFFILCWKKHGYFVICNWWRWLKKVKTLIKVALILDHNLQKSISYNLFCRIIKLFHCNEYNHVLIHYHKISNFEVIYNLNINLKFCKDKRQKYLLYNDNKTLWDKKCEPIKITILE